MVFNIVLLFSKISIVFYGIGVAFGVLLENSSRVFAIIFVLAYGCTLPSGLSITLRDRILRPYLNPNKNFFVTPFHQ